MPDDNICPLPPTASIFPASSYSLSGLMYFSYAQSLDVFYGECEDYGVLDVYIGPLINGKLSQIM